MLQFASIICSLVGQMVLAACCGQSRLTFFVNGPMSERARSAIAITMLVSLAASAFAAGFFTNDFVETNLGGDLSFRKAKEFELFWEAWERIEEDFYGPLPSSQGMTHGAIRGAFATLNDPYTVFIEPAAREEERESLEGTFGGVGAYLRRPEDGGPIYLDPIPGNPAEIAGILPGDVLLAVDGVEITPATSVAEVRDMVKGEKGTSVILTVLHEGGAGPIDIEIVRGEILIPSVDYRLLADQRIGYLRLSRFSGESNGEVRDAIEALADQGMEFLILDLRDNGGGLLDAAVDVADLFLSGGPILHQQRQGEPDRLFEATADTLLPVTPLVLLINGGSASASEIVAGALQDRERAILIGSRSFGKGSVQLVYDLSDGSSVHVTSARWFTPDRQPIDQNGIQPDIPVEVTQEAIDNGRDEILERAIQFFQTGE